ncbi:MAG TPA: c-type cytochrome domain-containing protein [Terriglobales bacterium]|jgi:uncharacterized membrane protein
MSPWGSLGAGRFCSKLVWFSPILLVFVLIAFLPPEGKEGAHWIQFIGRFHLLVVHFPIALILLVPVLEVVGRFQRFSYLRLSSGFVLGVATMAAIVAAFLGWCLARTGGYSGTLVTQHMWGGVGLTAICWLCWILRGWTGEPNAQKYYAAALTAGVLLVSWTGYRGGQISQGEDHLTEYMPLFLRHAIGLPDNTPLALATADSFYTLRVQPIFADRCVTCHGPKKQKSGLRLDSYGWVMRGGKHGAVLKAGNAQGSDLFRRITLSPDHDDFMPKGKKQPVPPDQSKLIELWIGAGASGTLPLTAMKNLPTGRSIAAAPIQVSFPEINPLAVAKARESFAAAVAQLQKKFPNILDYESRGSADLVLNASLLGSKFGDSDLQSFATVAEHITVADFSRTAITDHAASAIATMKRLRDLRLGQTKITDATVKALIGCDQLQSLNVYGTEVTAAALPLLEKLPKLEHFYAGQTAISPGITVPQRLTGKLVL